MNNDENEMMAVRVMEYIMMQLSLKKGLNIFGKQGEDAIKKLSKCTYYEHLLQ